MEQRTRESIKREILADTLAFRLEWAKYWLGAAQDSPDFTDEEKLRARAAISHINAAIGEAACLV